MAKVLQARSATRLSALLFCFLFITSYEMLVGEAICPKRSQMWKGSCVDSDKCENICITKEMAVTRACQYPTGARVFPCYCYFTRC
ncbi:defensin-like protein 14 [Phtheirospermum japonicum]|uniref:Defensin-like protein 14 n=1 Tax=Phtheirospermum japonicum TaxID=374723 RepID=A0A830BVR5_9LAMI|nr:defensin-like protein 14 [Phtheirospermum japonicum]